MQAHHMNSQLKTLAHDFKAPLTALRFCATEIEATSQDMLERCIDMIDNLVNTLAKLGDKQNINGVSRPVEIAAKLLPAFKARAHAKNIELQAWLPRQLSMIKSPLENIELERALMNVVTNAIEASAADSVVELSARLNGKYLEFSIVDRGAGIPRELLSQVTLPGVSFGKTHGDGLGLFQVKSTLEGRGGRLTIDSTEGVGTEVILHLPIIESSDSLKAPQVLQMCS
jgi:signal transduction histidine kinase